MTERHVVEFTWDRDWRVWRWACSCERYDGLSNVKPRAVASARRHLTEVDLPLSG